MSKLGCAKTQPKSLHYPIPSHRRDPPHHRRDRSLPRLESKLVEMLGNSNCRLPEASCLDHRRYLQA